MQYSQIPVELPSTGAPHIGQLLTFIRTKDESNNINECPRCGAPVEGNSTGICEYCKSKLVNDNYNWVMSKKEIVKQR